MFSRWFATLTSLIFYHKPAGLTLTVKSSQVKYIYIALFTIQIVLKLLHSINQNNLTVFVYYWKKQIQVW